MLYCFFSTVGHPELHTLFFPFCFAQTYYFIAKVWHYICSLFRMVENPLSQMRGRKQQRHFIAFDVSPSIRRVAHLLPDKMGAGSHICLFSNSHCR